MIVFNKNRIIDIVCNNHIINKVVLSDNIIHQRSIEFNGATHINVGDGSEYSLVICDKVYKNVQLQYDKQSIIYDNNMLYFLSPGKYNITIIYKTYLKTITVDVQDISISIE